MVESDNEDNWKQSLTRIESFLDRSAGSEEEQARMLGEQSQLARVRTETTSKLLPYLSTTALNTEKQTALAQERTALTREQTHLSTRSTELSAVRTDLGRERTSLAEQRTDLAVQRTDMSSRRTSLAEGQSRLAQKRNELAEFRNVLSRTRNRLSLQRTEQSRERTYLSLVRTGLALLTVGISLFRYFGLSPWSLFDLGLVIISLFVIFFGVRGYRRAKNSERRLDDALAEDPGFAGLV